MQLTLSQSLLYTAQVLQCCLQVLNRIAACVKVYHPNIVAIIGVSEYPATKDLLLVGHSHSHTFSNLVSVPLLASLSQHQHDACYDTTTAVLVAADICTIVPVFSERVVMVYGFPWTAQVPAVHIALQSFRNPFCDSCTQAFIH